VCRRFLFYAVFHFYVVIHTEADNFRLDIIRSERMTTLLNKPQLITRDHCVCDDATDAKQNDRTFSVVYDVRQSSTKHFSQKNDRKNKTCNHFLLTVQRPTVSSVTEKHERPSAILFQFSYTNMR
jgi:hypothetical protein